MLIISKYKDYYDYLVGTYGIDKNIILDRRAGTVLAKYSTPYIITTIAICGLSYDLYYDKLTRKFYFGEEILNVIPSDNIYTRSNHDHPDKYYLRDSFNTFRTKPYTTNLNIEHSCPILIERSNGVILYPKLAEYQAIPRIIPATEMYFKLYNWLTPTDKITDNRTNSEKILSSGFDLKTSFRNIK